MTAQDPLEHFLSQITDLMRFVNMKRQFTSKEGISQEIEDRLTHLEELSQLLSKITEETLQKTGVKEEQVKEAITSKEKMTTKDRILLERASELKKEVEAARKEIAVEVTIAKQHRKFTGKAGKAVQTRKKRFRRMGGREDWKPL